MKRLASIILTATGVFLFIACGRPDKADGLPLEHRTPEYVGNMLIDNLLSRPGFMIYRTDFLTAVHYAEACAGFGAARFAGLTGDTTAIQKLIARYEPVLHDTVLNTVHHVDAQVYGILPLELYMQTDDDRFLKQGIELADMQWDRPTTDGLTPQARFWIDDIWMIAGLQVQAYRAARQPVYLDRAALAVRMYLEKLQQPNGLFHHGTDAPFFWGRGNGWVAAGLAELLSELPETHIEYAAIAAGYIKMMDALVRYQSDDGMWLQLIDVSESWKETSATAMFGYALSVGVSRNILDDPKYISSYRKAWNALMDYIDEDGNITDICVGTGKSDDIGYYLTRPRSTGDLHGQAPMLWFAYTLYKE